MEPRTAGPQSAQAGFTLVETLVAILVLSFGLMAVTNLLVVAASSNGVANQGTAAATSSTRVMDMLKATSFANLTVGGVAWEVPPPAAAGGALKLCSDATLAVTDWHCQENVPGVGQVHTHWWITATTDPRLFYITTQSEGVGALAAARSRATFSTYRACTNSDAASGLCPDAPAGAQVLP